MRPFTTRFVNPITRLVAPWLPGFGLLQYRGQKSGKVRVTEFLRMRIDRTG